jgi:hypothetical protein
MADSHFLRRIFVIETGSQLIGRMDEGQPTA